MKHAIILLVLTVAQVGLAVHAAWQHETILMILWLLAATFSGFWGCIGFAIETRTHWRGRDYYRKN